MESRGTLPRGASHAMGAALAAAIVVAWGLVVWPMLDMHGGAAHLMMPASAAWTTANVAAAFAMWAVMMAAMMLPGAVPMVLLYGQLVARGDPRMARRRTFIFVLAYLLTWAGYSLGATAVQWGLRAALVLSPMGAVTSPWVTAALLVGAGAYQLTPMKDACLSRCRSPFGFLTTEWRGGDRGALVMGLRHGSFCIGCCWALMALAFVGGTMNLVWMAVLTAVVTVEKVAPRGRTAAQVLGALLICGGLAYAVAFS